MPNQHVYRGSDAKLILYDSKKITHFAEGRPPSSPQDYPLNHLEKEDTKTKTILGNYFTNSDYGAIVARLTNVKVTVTSRIKPFHEIGRRLAAEIRPGNIDVSGFVERAYINGALLNLLMGDYCTNTSPTDTDLQPSFIMQLEMKNPAQSSPSTNFIYILGVRFESWNYQLPEDNFIMESLCFKAINVYHCEGTELPLVGGGVSFSPPSP